MRFRPTFDCTGELQLKNGPEVHNMPKAVMSVCLVNCCIIVVALLYGQMNAQCSQMANDVIADVVLMNMI